MAISPYPIFPGETLSLLHIRPNEKIFVPSAGDQATGATLRLHEIVQFSDGRLGTVVRSGGRSKGALVLIIVVSHA